MARCFWTNSRTRARNFRILNRGLYETAGGGGGIRTRICLSLLSGYGTLIEVLVICSSPLISVDNKCSTGAMKGLQMKKTILVAVFVAILGSTGFSWSADYQKGYAASQSGDFATALREWTPLAEQGDAGAQFNLGLMYAKGHTGPATPTNCSGN
jgi:hypothetical protein